MFPIFLRFQIFDYLYNLCAGTVRDAFRAVHLPLAKTELAAAGLLTCMGRMKELLVSFCCTR